MKDIGHTIINFASIIHKYSRVNSNVFGNKLTKR